MISLSNLKKELKKKSNNTRAKSSQWFFKTGSGEYGEGDIFIGVTVPEIRKIAKDFIDLQLNKTQKLLRSKIHEERLCALIILTIKFNKADEKLKKEIYKLYLENTKYINNWDLVDSSAHKIVGAYLESRPRTILYKLAKSLDLWEKRIAIIATFHFIHNGEFEDTLKISEILLYDEHDLIHKAVGWMLREIGKKDLKTEEKILKKHYNRMPRTMLRYAIEHFPEDKRKSYLKK